MRLGLAIIFISVFGSAIANAIAQPGVSEAAPELERRDDHVNELVKRKGGGGGGGRGGGGGGGRSSGSSGSRGGSSSSGGSGSSSSSTSPKGSSGGSSGGSRGSGGSSGSSGTGAPRSFGGGKFYGGGASAPYKAGSKSPKGIAPVFFIGAAALAFWPATWAFGVYHYPYTQPYRFHNDTANEDENLPVICGCDPYNPCGCDENDDDEYLDALVGNGDPKNFNTSLVSVADVNGTTTLLINGTLPNGTTAPEDAVADASSGVRSGLEMLGWWPMVAAVAGAVFMA